MKKPEVDYSPLKNLIRDYDRGKWVGGVIAFLFLSAIVFSTACKPNITPDYIESWKYSTSKHARTVLVKIIHSDEFPKHTRELASEALDFRTKWIDSTCTCRETDGTKEDQN